MPSNDKLVAADQAAELALQISGLPHAHDYYRITGAKPVIPLPPITGDSAHSGVGHTRGHRRPEPVFGA